MRRDDLKKLATLSCANAEYNYLQQLTLTLLLNLGLTLKLMNRSITNYETVYSFNV